MMHIYKIKSLWLAFILAMMLIATTILVAAWIDGLNGEQFDPRIYLMTIVIVPMVLYGLFVYPRMRIVLTDDDIQLHGLTKHKIKFKDLQSFKIHANAVLLVSPKTRFWISRGFDRQWEIADFVARKLVSLGRITHKEYEDMTRLFHGHKGKA